MSAAPDLDAAQASLLDSVKGLIATLLAIGETRLHLLSVDLEEQYRQFLVIALYGIAAVLLLVIGVLGSVVLLVLYLWDTHRLLAVGVVFLGFFGSAGVSALLCMFSIRRRPPIFSASLVELNKDIAQLRPQS